MARVKRRPMPRETPFQKYLRLWRKNKSIIRDSWLKNDFQELASISKEISEIEKRTGLTKYQKIRLMKLKNARQRIMFDLSARMVKLEIPQ